jgi:hypothetical protein
MTNTELKRVAKQLDLPESWEIMDMQCKNQDKDLSTDYIFVKVHTKGIDEAEVIKSFRENADRIVKQLNRLTAKTADGTWKYTDSTWKKSYYTINFYVDFAMIRAVTDDGVRWKSLPLGKKYRRDKLISLAQIKRAINKYFDEGKMDAVAALARLTSRSRNQVTMIDFEEIRFTYE